MIELKTLQKRVEEKDLYHSIFKSVIELLAENNDIDGAAEIIKESLGLHTCYISYDIDTRTDKANIAGLASDFGPWFDRLTRANHGIPFNFTQDDEGGAVNAATFLRSCHEPVIIPPHSYCHLFVASDIAGLSIDVRTVHRFLTAEPGELLIVPLKKNGGVMILIRKSDESFSDDEINFLSTLSKSIALTLNRMYHTFHDELGIKNIVFFRQQLENLWKGNAVFGVLFIKLKGLRQINDDYSHFIGNKLLRKIIERLVRLLEKLEYQNPGSLVARKSGVIIMVCLPETGDKALLDHRMSIINEHLVQPYRLDDRLVIELEHTIRFGGCLSSDAHDVEELLDHAYDALQETRRINAKPRVIFGKLLAKRKRWRKNILRVLKQFEHVDEHSPDKLCLVYQEKIDARDFRIIGYEALLRLQLRGAHIIKPDYFIKIAEEENLIGMIDLWVVREACMQIKKWADEGRALPVSINISRYHISNSSLVTEIAEIFRAVGFNDYRHLLKIEITETGLLSKKSIDGLIRLHDVLGLKVSIDDVGKNQANLHAILTLYINNLLESVKIDREYVRKVLLLDENGGLVPDGNGEAMLDVDGCKYILSMLNMFKGLFNTPGIAEPLIICEGIEFKQQEQWLLDNHCYFLQGFLYGKPEPACVCEQRLAERNMR